MTFKRIPHKSGKGWVRVGRPNARVKARIVEQLIRDTLLTTGAMPSGVYTLEYGFINPNPMSLTVDFDTLADEAFTQEGAAHGAQGGTARVAGCDTLVISG